MSDIVERLRGTYSTGPFGKRDFAPFIPAIQVEAADEIERLQTRLAEAERDAERYRWLRDHINKGQGWVVMRREPSGMWDQMPSNELDSAIDALRAADSADAVNKQE